jgi:hypothetical protein
MFLPGKQYLYGLHLLGIDPDRLAAFQEALASAGAPPWPEGARVKDTARDWVRQTRDKNPQGRWWGLIEEHALRALARAPDMDFGLLDFTALAALPVVACGAAKNLYERETQPALEAILSGRSLNIYRRRTAEGAAPADPIAEVMVAAKASIGRFGGALRRLIYTARPLRPEHVQQAQSLTEQVTQKALSVKAGKPPVQYGEYESQLRRLLQGKTWDVPEGSELAGILGPMAGVWDSLRTVMSAEPAVWLEWLRKPHELADLLTRADGGTLRLPLDDLRLACWVADGPAEAPEESAGPENP